MWANVQVTFVVYALARAPAQVACALTGSLVSERTVFKLIACEGSVLRGWPSASQYAATRRLSAVSTHSFHASDRGLQDGASHRERGRLKTVELTVSDLRALPGHSWFAWLAVWVMERLLLCAWVL
jgi:hypothetical protein